MSTHRRASRFVLFPTPSSLILIIVTGIVCHAKTRASAAFVPTPAHSIAFLAIHQRPCDVQDHQRSRPPSLRKQSTTSTDPTMPTTRQGSLLISAFEQVGNEVTGTDDSPKFGLVLASQSPRRREILDMMGLAGRYRAQPSPLDETALQEELTQIVNLTPVEYTERLAKAKAEALALHDAKSSTSRQIVFYLGSDTIVDLDGTILEKPKDEADAKRMLRELSGNCHQVHTGVALYKLDTDSAVSLVDSFVETANVTFTELTDCDIDAYVASGEPMDKAGSYGIQGIGGQIVSGLQGDFFAVMGLPMHGLSRSLMAAFNSTNIDAYD